MKSNPSCLFLPQLCVILIALVSNASASTAAASTAAASNASAKTDKAAEKPSYFRCLASNQDITGLFVTQSELPGPKAPTPTPTPTPTPSAKTPKPTPAAKNPKPTPEPVYKEDQLMIPGAVRSQIYSYLPSKPLKIVRHVGDKIVLVSTLDMQHAPPLALLLFMPGKDAGLPDIKVIDDAVSIFPGGGVEIFNFSHLVPTFDFETTAGKQSIQMDPGSSKIIPLQFDPNSTAGVTISVPGKSAPTFSSAWDMFSSIRYMAFVIDDPKDKSNVVYTRVPDNITNLQLDLKRLEKPPTVDKPAVTKKPTPDKTTH